MHCLLWATIGPPTLTTVVSLGVQCQQTHFREPIWGTPFVSRLYFRIKQLRTTSDTAPFHSCVVLKTPEEPPAAGLSSVTLPTREHIIFKTTVDAPANKDWSCQLLTYPVRLHSARKDQTLCAGSDPVRGTDFYTRNSSLQTNSTQTQT